MTASSLGHRLRRVWNWIRGKRISVSDPKRGRVMIRTGKNSANRNHGGQWYLLRYDTANGLPPLPLGCRGRLHNAVTTFRVERFSGDELLRARHWYETRHGPLRDGQDLVLVCVYDPDNATPESRVMHYAPDETFEIEHPWLSSEYRGPSFATYCGTWYGSGMLKEDHIMDFEMFCDVHPGWKPLPSWGASWR